MSTCIDVQWATSTTAALNESNDRTNDADVVNHMSTVWLVSAIASTSTVLQFLNRCLKRMQVAVTWSWPRHKSIECRNVEHRNNNDAERRCRRQICDTISVDDDTIIVLFTHISQFIVDNLLNKLAKHFEWHQYDARMQTHTQPHMN